MVNHTLKSIFTSSDTQPKRRMTTSDLANRKYIRWDAPGVESPPPGEEDDINAVAEQINTQQRQQFDNHRHVYTGTHCRTQGIVKGTFIVHDKIPAYLKQGELFSQGCEYPAACRYSTEPGDPGMDDRVPNPRGFSMKLFNVQGERFEAGKDLPTQDIEFNSTPAIELATAKVTREIFDIRMKVGGDMDAMNKELEARNDTELQKARFKVPVKHPASIRQYSQSAYRYGDLVFKYCLVPNTTTQQNLYNSKPSDNDPADFMHTWLHDFHLSHDAEYLFQVQLLENLSEQPVEYAGSAWDEEKYPWQTVATLKILKQEAWNMKRKRFWEDNMRLDPWLGLKAYQPLGSANRLRKVVYYASSKLRREMNGTEEVWVKNIDEIP